MLTYLSIYQRNKDRFYQKKKGWIDENVNDESCLLKFEKLQIARICLFFFFYDSDGGAGNMGKEQLLDYFLVNSNIRCYVKRLT